MLRSASPFAVNADLKPITDATALEVGMRVHCATGGAGWGTIYRLEGQQDAASVVTFAKGAGVSGGRARVWVVFDRGGTAQDVPEAIVRGIAWTIDPMTVWSAGQIEAALAFAHALAEQKRAEKAAGDAQHAAELARLRAAPEWARLAQGDDRYSGKLAAKNIRAVLKIAFPSTKFSVRCSDRGTIRIGWTDGPTVKDVQGNTALFEGGHFDGHQDCYVQHRSAWCEVFGGAQYVFHDRAHSDELIRTAIDQLWGIILIEGVEKPSVEAYRSGACRVHQIPGLSHRDLGDLIRDALSVLRG